LDRRRLINDLGQSMEAGLLAPGVGLEHFLDRRMDAEDAAAGVQQGTPRTIEGPLYVANAPLVKGTARLDDGTDTGEVLFMRGVVRDLNGKPVSGAIVDVWHANPKGMYSFFDKSQSKYNLRRRIETDTNGRYEFRTIMPAPVTVVRPTVLPSGCWTRWAGTASGRRTSTSLSRLPDIVI
jgi:catechol 1,2-dioxygenase